MSGARIPCVGAIAHDPRGRILLVRRANEPARGLWSLPGGRVEPGESHEAAVVREVLEETGLEASVVREVGTIERDAPEGGTYVIRDFVVEVTGGALVPGDDASGAAWFTRAELAVLPTSPGLIEALTDWALLPAD